jgi:hypothetical protein
MGSEPSVVSVMNPPLSKIQKNYTNSLKKLTVNWRRKPQG